MSEKPEDVRAWVSRADEAMERGDHASASRALEALAQMEEALSEEEALRLQGYRGVLAPDPLATWMVVVGSLGLVAILLLLYAR